MTKLGRPRRHYASVGSTNDEALQWARAGAPHGAVVTAAAQSQGRGRRGREWSSPAGQGLYLSLILRPGCGPDRVAQLTMIAALAGARLVESLTGLTTQVKWPNDVILHGKKIGGILSEAELADGAVRHVVVGLGLNLNQQADELPARPLFPASSLRLETGRSFDIEAAAEGWLAEFAPLNEMLETGGWPALLQEFGQRCVGLGGAVTVTTEAEVYKGTARAIGADGTLVVETDAGPRRVVAGDVQVDLMA